MPDNDWLEQVRPIFPDTSPDQKTPSARPPLGYWNGGDIDDEVRLPAPRQWVLGNTFCRGFLSSLVAEGGTGKSVLRMTQAIAVATGRQLTHEKVHRQTRVLYVSLEDDTAELKRRLRAALMHHQISYADIRDQLWLACPSDDWEAGSPIADYTLAYTDRGGQLKIGAFLKSLVDAISEKHFGLVIIDPFVKLHAINENSNPEIDFICRVLASLAMHHNVAIDVPHHTAKLNDGGGSRSNRARGGSAFRDAVRLLYTLAPMTAEEASELGVNDEDRRRLVRLDSGKVNITLPPAKAVWYRLVGVPIGNSNKEYPNGDNVQVIECWDAPDMWDALTIPVANQILDILDAGLPNEQRFSTASQVKDEVRQAWRIVLDHVPSMSEKQAKSVISGWLTKGMIENREYNDKPSRKTMKGIYVLRRPG